MRVPVLLFLISFAMQGADNKPATPASIASGKKLFAASCSVGYCHGAEGRAGRGPRLRDREWDRGYLFKVIDEGIPNSSMPGWHGRLSSDQMASIVAYILSIGKEATGGGPSAGVAAKAPAKSVAPPATAPSAPGSIPGDIAAGKELFFDSTNDRNCGVCHDVAGASGIAPDLARMSAAAPRELLERILLPRVRNGKEVEIVTRDGEKLRGLIAEESGTRVRLLDLTSAGPPVLRTLQPAQIAQRRAIQAGAVHGNPADAYTMHQLLDLIAYIKSTAGGTKVTLQDLF